MPPTMEALFAERTKWMKASDGPEPPKSGGGPEVLRLGGRPAEPRLVPPQRPEGHLRRAPPRGDGRGVPVRAHPGRPEAQNGPGGPDGSAHDRGLGGPDDRHPRVPAGD